MKLDVLNIQGDKTGRTVELVPEVFGVDVNEHAVYLAVKQFRNAQRQGTHAAKERWAIAGSTRKLKRQKGTGTARAGSIKSPVFRGGGRVFGPKPRDYSIKLNKKVKSLARKSALTDMANSGNIIVVEDFSFDAARTKSFLEILSNLGIADKKVMLVTGDLQREVYLSSRNLPKASVVRAQDINTYQVLDANVLVLSESAVEAIVSNFN